MLALNGTIVRATVPGVVYPIPVDVVLFSVFYPGTPPPGEATMLGSYVMVVLEKSSFSSITESSNEKTVLKGSDPLSRRLVNAGQLPADVAQQGPRGGGVASWNSASCGDCRFLMATAVRNSISGQSSLWVKSTTMVSLLLRSTRVTQQGSKFWCIYLSVICGGNYSILPEFSFFFRMHLMYLA